MPKTDPYGSVESVESVAAESPQARSERRPLDGMVAFWVSCRPCARPVERPTRLGLTQDRLDDRIVANRGTAGWAVSLAEADGSSASSL